MSKALSSFHENADVYPQRRKVGLSLLVVFLLVTALSCTAGLMLFGGRVYYRDWNSVRTWSRPKAEAGLLGSNTTSRQDWYATVDRHARRNIFMKTDSDFALGMVLVVRSETSTVTGYAQRRRGERWWRLTETSLNGQDERPIEVRGRAIIIGDVEFSHSAGQLVLIGERGDVTQHTFTSEAQSSAELEDDVQKFIAELHQP